MNVAETLANLGLAKIVVAVAVATGFRLALARLSGPTARSINDILESGIIAIVLVYLLIRPFALQAFFVPTSSMEPTLLGNNGVGDRILVNKLVYRYSTPQRGDVVVFIPPQSAIDPSDQDVPGVPPNFIKRLVGEPGDVLLVHAGKVIVNGEAYGHDDLLTRFAAVGLTDDRRQPALQDRPFLKFVPDGVLVNGRKLIDKTTIASIVAGNPNASVTIVPGYTTRNGARVPDRTAAEDPDYDMRIYHGQPLRATGTGPEYDLDGMSISPEEYQQDAQSPPEPVPGGTYFMMGDNRNNSKDSTYWGPLDKNRVVGKAEYIFWPPSRVRAIR